MLVLEGDNLLVYWVTKHCWLQVQFYIIQINIAIIFLRLQF